MMREAEYDPAVFYLFTVLGCIILMFASLLIILTKGIFVIILIAPVLFRNLFLKLRKIYREEGSHHTHPPQPDDLSPVQPTQAGSDNAFVVKPDNADMDTSTRAFYDDAIRRGVDIVWIATAPCVLVDSVTYTMKMCLGDWWGKIKPDDKIILYRVVTHEDAVADPNLRQGFEHLYPVVRYATIRNTP
jgi:hypothetical protein